MSDLEKLIEEFGETSKELMRAQIKLGMLTQAKPITAWISVKDRLPENEQKVVFLYVIPKGYNGGEFDYHNEEICSYTCKYDATPDNSDEAKKWRDGETAMGWCGLRVDLHRFVYLWMPQPPPPEEA